MAKKTLLTLHHEFICHQFALWAAESRFVSLSWEFLFPSVARVFPTALLFMIPVSNSLHVSSWWKDTHPQSRASLPHIFLELGLPFWLAGELLALAAWWVSTVPRRVHLGLISLVLPMFSSGVTFLPSHVLGVPSPQSLSSVLSLLLWWDTLTKRDSWNKVYFGLRSRGKTSGGRGAGREATGGAAGVESWETISHPQTGSRSELEVAWNSIIKGHAQWHTPSNKAVPPKGSIISPKQHCQLGPSVQIHEPTGTTFTTVAATLVAPFTIAFWSPV